MYPPILRVHRSAKDSSNDTCVIFFSDFLYKSMCCGYSFEMHRQVDAIQMSTHDIYTCCNQKLDCSLIGVCVVIRLNTVPLSGDSHVHHNVCICEKIRKELKKIVWLKKHLIRCYDQIMQAGLNQHRSR